MRHRLAEPCHDRKLHSTDFIYSFDVGKTNQLLRKQNSDTEPQSHIAYSIVLSSVFSCCDLAGTFNVLTYTAATYHVAGLFLRRVSFIDWVTVYTQPADGVDGTPHPIVCFRWDLWGIYQFYVIYTCDCTLIYTLMYCVCQHTDPGMAQKHRGLTVWGRVATDMVSEHMLTVGRDPRNRKALGQDFSKTLFSKRLLLLIFSDFIK